MIPVPDLIQSLLLLKTRIIKTPPSNMPEKAIVFDVDGTLIDSVDLHTRAWQEALKEVGSHIQFAELRSQIGKGADMFLPSFLTQEKIERCGKKVSKRQEEIFNTGIFSQATPLASAPQLFSRWTVVLASSGKRREVDHHKKLLKIENSSTWRSVRKRCNNRNRILTVSIWC